MNRVLIAGAIAAVTTAGLSATPAQATHTRASTGPTSTVITTSTTKADPGFTPSDRAALLANARHTEKATAAALRLPTGVRLIAKDAMRDTNGATHIRYERRLDGLRVIGGDLVVHRARSGAISSVDLASKARIAVASIVAKTAAPKAGHSTRVVYAVHHKPVLAWQTHIRGIAKDQTPINRVVYTNATTGHRLGGWSLIDTADGTGKSLYDGNVTISTTLSGSTYQLNDGTRGGHKVYDKNGSTSTATGTLFTDADNVWGNNATTDRATVAVDAAYGGAMTWDFYKNTFGRTGIKNNGVAAYSRVHYGSGYENAFWDDSCFCMTYGDGGSTFSPLVSLDVAGHEMSHGVTANTAGLNYSGESGGLNESTSDIFGTMVEFYANNANDQGDYYIGEKIAKNGTYLRRMDNPSLDGGSANCWSSGVGNLDVHYSSGVGNHFFYLLSEGTGAKTIGGRAHNGPTCNGSTLTGIGRTAAAAIWYRALTTYMVSTTNYKGARDATIQAARDLYGATSTQCTAVAATWDAVSVPVGAQTCGGGGGGGSNLLVNPGFESGASGWSQTTGVISTGGSAGPRTGAYVAWLDGYGTTHTDTLSQSVAIPSAASASLSFWLKITSSETSTTTAYDTLKVQVTSGATTTTLATYSNVNKGTAYVQRTLNLSAYAGQTVTVKFLGVEDSSLATSFRVDDTSLTTT